MHCFCTNALIVVMHMGPAKPKGLLVIHVRWFHTGWFETFVVLNSFQGSNLVLTLTPFVIHVLVYFASYASTVECVETTNPELPYSRTLKTLQCKT